ncbi:toxin-antitoxin system YwqK family antitoxin [Streptomyces angustmyceticus]
MTLRIEGEETYIGNDLRVYHQDSLFTGEVISRDAQNRVIGLAHYVEGISCGPQVQWYSDGSRKSEGQSEMGVAVGEWRRWHANGQLAERYVFTPQGQWVRRQRWGKDGKCTVDRSYGS